MDFTLLHRFKGEAEAINLAGRQQVLSQKIIDRIAYNLGGERNEQKLYRQADRWLFQHKVLQRGNDSLQVPRLEDERLQQLVNKATPHFMAIYTQIQDYRNGGCTQAELQAVTNKNGEAFLSLMDEIEERMEEYNEENLVLAEEVQLATIFIMAGLIIFSYIFVIYPYTQKMKEQLLLTKQNREQVLSKNNELSNRIESVKQQNEELGRMKEQLAVSLREQDALNQKLNEKFSQLYRQTEQLDTAQQLSHIGYWSHDLQSTIVWSDRMYEIFGATRPEGAPGPSEAEFYSHIYPEDVDLIKEKLEQAGQGHEVKYRHRIRRASGEERVISSTIKPELEQGTDKVTGLFGIVQDITDAVRREEEIKLFNNSLKQVVHFSNKAFDHFEESLEEIMLYSTKVLDMEQCIIGKAQGEDLFSIDLAKSLLPDRPESIQGINVPLKNSIFELTYKARELCIIHDTAHEEYEYLHDVHNSLPRGYIGSPIQVNERTIGILAFESDGPINKPLTPYEREYVRLLARVIGFVLDRHESRRKLEQANQDQENILHIIAHDIRSPLNKLHSLLEVVAQHPTSQEEKDRYFELATQEYQGAMRLVEEMLDSFSMQHLTEKERENLSELFNELLDRIAPSFKNKGVTLNRQISDNISDWVYPNRLQRVLDNLLSNALKFTPQGGEVSVNLHCSETHWVLEVKDSGIGIPKELQPDLFKKFNKKIRRKGLNGEKSTGLGMSIVKEIAEQHQGEVSLKTAKWKGTRITITIPFQQEKKEAP